MSESRFLESFYYMARSAVLLDELPHVWVLGVAVSTAFECHFGELLVDMAIGAWNWLMRPAQGVSGLFMIECGDGPGVRVMTSLTVASQARLMRVLMTTDALSKTESFPLLVGMTFDAVDSSMCAYQWKSCSVVVERNLLEFIVEGVTPFTIFT
jgi:hypothetical protein